MKSESKATKAPLLFHGNSPTLQTMNSYIAKRYAFQEWFTLAKSIQWGVSWQASHGEICSGYLFGRVRIQSTSKFRAWKSACRINFRTVNLRNLCNIINILSPTKTPSFFANAHSHSKSFLGIPRMFRRQFAVSQHQRYLNEFDCADFANYGGLLSLLLLLAINHQANWLEWRPAINNKLQVYKFILPGIN